MKLQLHKKKPKLAPIQVINDKQILRLQSDNFPRENGKPSLLLAGGGQISIHLPDGKVLKMSKFDFDRMVRWYVRPQTLRSAWNPKIKVLHD